MSKTDRLTTIEAAEYLGIKPGYLHQMRHHGKGPKFVKEGGRVYYLRPELKAYKEERAAKQRERAKAADAKAKAAAKRADAVAGKKSKPAKAKAKAKAKAAPAPAPTPVAEAA